MPVMMVRMKNKTSAGRSCDVMMNTPFGSAALLNLVGLDRGIQLNASILFLRVGLCQPGALQRLSHLRGKVSQQAAVLRRQRDGPAPELDGSDQSPVIQDSGNPVGSASDSARRRLSARLSHHDTGRLAFQLDSYLHQRRLKHLLPLGGHEMGPAQLCA